MAAQPCEQTDRRMRRTFVAFRRCVRGTYGSSSKEYRDLLDKQYRKRRGNPEPAPTPA